MRNLLFLAVSGILFVSCSKSFIPASKKDVQDATQSTEKAAQAATCVNENIILTFSPTDETKGQASVKGQMVVSSTIEVGLSDRILKSQKNMASISGSGAGWIVYEFSPTVLDYKMSNKAKNRAFVKSICANAHSASLVNFSIEYTSKANQSNVFDSRKDTVHEIWACHGLCQ